MKKLDRQRKITLMALSMALVVAVYLNWQYSRTGADLHIITEEVDASQQEILDVMEQYNLNAEGDMLQAAAEEEIRNYGDAQLVATTAESAKKYFEETRLSRKKTRDEALDVLQKSLKNAKMSDAEKTQATEKLTKIIQNMTAETDVENLVKAKGFTDCVAFINEDKISVAVQPSKGSLSQQNVAQIRDIVLSKTAVSTENIVIIEVK